MEGEYDVLSVLRGLLHLGLYDEISGLIARHEKFHINVSVEGESLLSVAAEHRSIEDVKFCVESGATKGLGYAASKALHRTDAIPIIDYLLKNGAGAWSVFHYSISGDRTEIAKHLLTHWPELIEPSWVEEALSTSGRFGHCRPVKFVCETKPCSEYFQYQDMQNCLYEAIMVDSGLTADRYDLIRYLTKERGIRLSDEAQMERVERLVAQYDPEKLRCMDEYAENSYFETHPGELERWKRPEDTTDWDAHNRWKTEHSLYMPDLFKPSEHKDD